MGDTYEVTIAESVAPPGGLAPGPMVRTVDWVGEAESEEAARAAAWAAWREQYGNEREPAEPSVRVNKVSD